MDGGDDACSAVGGERIARRLFAAEKEGEEKKMERIVERVQRKIFERMALKKARGGEISKQEKELKKRMKLLDKAVDRALADGTFHPLVKKIIRSDKDLRGSADLSDIHLAPDMSQELTDCVENYLFESDEEDGGNGKEE